MKFPKQELNVGDYLNKIKGLLSDNHCQIFIDTNIISQLYRLNDEAREDFYKWVDSCNNRFHVPVWVVHEYSNRVNSQNTKDYLIELSKIKTCSKDLNGISEFIKGYVGDSMLVGSSYDGKKNELFSDIDSVNSRLSAIASAINNKLNEHQSNVHKEIIEKLESRSLSSNIYEIMRASPYEYEVRITGKVPPGFKDLNKEQNANGDLIIWQEIISHCESYRSEDGTVKAILISRDNKPDMVYCPEKQINNERRASESEKIVLAHESLVYEFKSKTDSEDFYIINFNSLVRILASEYRALAKSFQIATAEENIQNVSRAACASEVIWKMANSVFFSNEDTGNVGEQATILTPGVEDINVINNDQILYSGTALIDSQYDYENRGGIVDEYIEKLKTYNWYEQNPAINQLMTLKTNTIESNLVNRSSFFVLGRNILQSAEGSSGSAISFVENLQYYTKNWDEVFKKALIDGCLYEVFFNSEGNIRPKNFKATYFADLVKNIESTNLENSFDFINTNLTKKGKTRFTPVVGSDKKYNFKFEFNKDQYTTSIMCNNIDISSTFPSNWYHQAFANVLGLKNSLSIYYAILEENITVEPLPSEITFVYNIFDESDLPF